MRLPLVLAAIGLCALARAGAAEPEPPADAAGTDKAADGYRTVVRSEQPPPARARRPQDVSRSTLNASELTRIPGQNDAVRAAENLPGVARSPFDSGQLIIRGAGPGDSATILHGFPVPLMFHFGNLTTIVNSDLLAGVDLVAGNFGARYGRATGGLLEVTTRAPKSRWTGYVDLSALDVKFLAEGPAFGGTLAIAARRSIVDLYLGAVLPDDAGVSFTQAPVYHDYQLLFRRRLGGGTLSALLFGTDDRLALLFARPVETDPALRGSVRNRLTMHRLHLLWWRRLGRAGQLHLGAALGYSSAGTRVGPSLGFALEDGSVELRAEYRHQLTTHAAVTVGLEDVFAPYRGFLRSPRPAREGDFIGRSPLSEPDLLETRRSGLDFTPALYAESELQLGRLRLYPGLRIDHYSPTGQTTLSPRLSARYRASARTTLKGGLGLYTQPPDVLESDPSFGNPQLRGQQAWHFSLGVEHDFGHGVSLDATAFAKRLGDVAVGSDLLRSDASVGAGGRLTPENLSNQGVGRIYGAELMLRRAFRGGLFAWLSYTVMRSERRDSPDAAYRPFDFDQRHILSAVVSKQWGRGWQLGARFRYVTGNPTTSVRGAIYDADADVYIPLPGRSNTERMPAFHQLDLRLDKQSKFRHWSLSRYIDVQNLYAHDNVESYGYSFDYRSKRPTLGLPLLITAGLRAEF